MPESGRTDVTVSRALAHALRHDPWRYGLVLDHDGWTDVDDVVEALRRRGRSWRDLTAEDLRRVVDGAGDGRYVLVDGRIRARYGHSLPDILTYPRTTPPAQLFHGTAASSVASILREGLLPGRRQYVHLSPHRDRAVRVGRRRSDEVVVLVVDAAEASSAGTDFHRASELVWLTGSVPPRYVRNDPGAG